MTQPIEPSDEDIERQKKREADGIQEGIARLIKRREHQRATDSKPVRDLMAEAWESLVDVIYEEQEALKAAGGSKLPEYGMPLLSLSAETLALIGLGILLNVINRSEADDDLPPTVTSVSEEIGQRCWLERMYDIDKKRAVDLAKQLRSRNNNRNAKRRSEDRARKFDKDNDSQDSCWLFLGERVIALAVRFAIFNGSPVFEFKTIRDEEKTPLRITLTAAADEWLLQQDSLPVFINPVHQPTAIPPRPWTSFSGGGFFSTPLNLLKRPRPARQWAQQQLEKADLSPVHSAVNAVQNTPFRINQPLHEFMQKAWNEGLPFFKLEECERRDQVRSRKAVVAACLSMAESLRKDQRFHYPNQIDHRGRAYSVTQLIHPQADDVGTAMLEFADGKALGENGPRWLAVHLANCFWKGEKVSFEKRRAWVAEHEREILAFAEDPLREHRFWREADKPWNFLRACLEWKGYREQGPGFVSHLPICMDGSCNGYQHLSAMGLDPIGGAATNLVPSQHPADIYMRVLGRVNQRLEKDARGGLHAEAARQLIGLINRSGVKPTTMTIPYGITLLKIQKELLKSGLLKHCKDKEKVAKYLAKILVECTVEVAVEAGKIMDWLREIARIYAKHNRGLVWTVPTGFVVIHDNLVGREVRARTRDRSFVLYKEDKAWRVDGRKQADGIVAHLVHSYDAAHMMLTVNSLYDLGLRHFVTVHDSYGVHACDVDTLHRVLREEFVRIYFEPVLQNFLNEQRAAYPYIEIPDVPQLGTLDIRQVLESLYFFA